MSQSTADGPPFWLGLLAEDAHGNQQVLEFYERQHESVTVPRRFLWWRWNSAKVRWVDSSEDFLTRCVEDARARFAEQELHRVELYDHFEFCYDTIVRTWWRKTAGVLGGEWLLRGARIAKEKA